MPGTADLDTALIAAFVGARYQLLQGARPWPLELGQRVEGPSCVSRLDRWCVITSHNPDGQQRSAGQNRRAARKMTRALLDNRPAVLLPTCGCDPDKRWPDEPGWLFSFTSPAQIHALATRFGQRAVLCGGGSKLTELWIYTEQKNLKNMQNAIDKQFENVRIVNS